MDLNLPGFGAQTDIALSLLPCSTYFNELLNETEGSSATTLFVVPVCLWLESS